MGFLRRVFGGRRGNDPDEASAGVKHESEDGSVEPDVEDREHELDLLRAEAERLDELAQRQLKYAHHAWQPPAQGGELRADDADRS